ncbi:hypothetical protein V6N13_077004 [Hibiscus sabdariffa]
MKAKLYEGNDLINNENKEGNEDEERNQPYEEISHASPYLFPTLTYLRLGFCFGDKRKPQGQDSRSNLGSAVPEESCWLGLAWSEVMKRLKDPTNPPPTHCLSLNT